MRQSRALAALDVGYIQTPLDLSQMAPANMAKMNSADGSLLQEGH